MVAALGDGTTVTGRVGGPLRRWSADATPATVIPSRRTGVVDLGASPDGRWLATVDEDRAITVSGVAAGHPAFRVTVADDHPSPAFAFSADGGLLATTGRREVRVWTVPGGRQVAVLPLTGWPTDLAFTADGRALLVAVETRGPLLPPDTLRPRRRRAPDQVLLWVLDELAPHVLALPYDDDGVQCVATSPCGRLAAVWTNGATHLLTLPDGRPAARMAVPGPPDPLHQLAFSPDGTILAVRTWHRLQLWSTRRASDPALLAEQGGLAAGSPTSAEFGPDGTTLAIGDDHDLVVLWRTDDPRPLRAMEGEPARRNVDRIAFTPDGRLVAAQDDRQVRVWWAATGEQAVEPIGVGEYPCSMAMHPSRPLLAVATERATRIHDLLGGSIVTEVADIRPRLGPSLAFSPDGTLLAGPVDDDTVGIWSTASWELQLRIAAWSPWLAFHPDGTLLATIDRTRLPRLWHVDDGRPGPTLAAPEAPPHRVFQPRSITFSPEGSLLVAGNLTTWRMGDGAVVDPTCGDILAFRADGRMLAATDRHRPTLWGVDCRP